MAKWNNVNVQIGGQRTGRFGRAGSAHVRQRLRGGSLSHLGVCLSFHTNEISYSIRMRIFLVTSGNFSLSKVILGPKCAQKQATGNQPMLILSNRGRFGDYTNLGSITWTWSNLSPVCNSGRCIMTCVLLRKPLPPRPPLPPPTSPSSSSGRC